MSINGVGTTPTIPVQTLVDLRTQLDDLNRQLGTGQKSATYAGVGPDAGLAVGLRAQLSAMTGYDNTIGTVGTSLQIAQNALTGMNQISKSVLSTTQVGTFALDNTGQTTGQENAGGQLGAFLDLLNTPAGDRYLFSGRAVDQPATDTLSHILDGNGAQAGFKQVVAERNQADLGANGLGRLVIPPAAGSVVSLSEDVAGSPFGFKLASVSSNLTNAVVTGPAGSPAAISVDLTAGNPNPGDTIKFTFNLPDGSSEDLTLTATTSAPPGPNQFTIGATPAATAANLQAALTGAVSTLASTALTAASAVAAGNDFFNTDASNPPQRVAGPPFDTATALVAGTPANTVTWYTGDASTDPARTTAVARVDPSLTVPYGMRANEQAIRNAVQSIAVFSTVTFSPSDPNAEARYSALASRVNSALADTPGVQKINDIAADLATAQATLATAKSRHQSNSAVLTDMVNNIEGINTDQVGAQVLQLQTQLQASLETTAAMAKLSLVNFITG
jgi:flagellin-like hook-associated protein FlgL